MGMNQLLSPTQEMNHIWHSIFAKAKDPIVIFSNNKISDCNQAAVDFFELSSIEECVATHPSALYPEYQPDGRSSFEKAKHMFALSKKRGSHQFYWVHQTANQTLKRVLVCLTDISTDCDEIFFGQLYSLKDQKELLWDEVDKLSTSNQQLIKQLNQPLFQTGNSQSEYELLHQHKRALDVSAIVSKTDVNGVITYVNDYFCNISGYSREELLGKTHNIVNHPEMPKEVFAELWQTILEGNVWQGVIQNKTKTGQAYFVSSTITPILNDSNEISEFISIRHDITELYEKENIILSSMTDHETKLGNKVKLLNEIRTGKYSQLALCRVNEFLNIQRVYTNQNYLILLNELVSFIKKNLPDGIELFRVNENLFGLLLRKTAYELDLTAYSRELNKAVNRHKFKFNKIKISLSTTIGISDIDNTDKSFSDASLALSYARKHNLQVSLFQKNNNLQGEVLNSLIWVQKLTDAIKQNGFSIFGQEIYDQRGDYYSTEILMRYKDVEQNRFVSPALYLDYARQAKLYDAISQTIIIKAFGFCLYHQQRISINIEYDDIANEATKNLIFTMLRQTRLGHLVTFELVESQRFDMESERLAEFLNELKTFGCSIAVDDFGTGYSNFDYLTRLPVDLIKIDGSLIKDIIENAKHQAIVKAIISFAHELGIEVVGEFVASKAISDCLTKLNVDYLQGFYLDEPQRLP